MAKRAYLKGDVLSARIKAHGEAGREQNVEAHELACSCVHLAITAGRASWLNEFYQSLERISQDAFRAWVLPNAPHWHGKEVTKEQRWVNFQSTPTEKHPTPRGFFMVSGAERPTIAMLDKIAGDLSLAFFNTTAAKANKGITSFEYDGWLKKFKGMINKLNEEAEQGNVVIPEKDMRSAQDMIARFEKARKLQLVVDNTTDEQPTAPVERDADKVAATA